MPIEHSQALVIKSVDFSESSLILTLFTREFGKIHGIAKGARRLKNPFESALDLMAQIDVSLICKNSNALDLLTESKLVHRFCPEFGNLAGLYGGYYLIELLGLMTVDYSPMPELFDLAVETLIRLEEKGRTPIVLLHFEWGLFHLLGEEPSLRYCIECQREISLQELIERRERLSFALHDGGALCPQCRGKGDSQRLASLSSGAVALLNVIAAGNIDRLGMTGDKREIEFPPSVWGEVRGLISYLIVQMAGRRPIMHEYFDVMMQR